MLGSASQLGGGQLEKVCKSLAGSVQIDLLVLHALVPVQPLPAVFWDSYVQTSVSDSVGPWLDLGASSFFLLG